MADYLYIFAAADSHIKFISENPDALWNFMEGSKCCLPEPRPEKGFLGNLFGSGEEEVTTLIKAPSGWPTGQVDMLGPEISNHNVELYHRILCGGDVFVSGAGALFQTWLVRENGVAIDIGKNGENFAFTSDQVSHLRELVSRVDESRVMYQYCLWLRKIGKFEVPSDKEVVRLTKEFKDLAVNLAEVEQAGKGIIWVKT